MIQRALDALAMRTAPADPPGLSDALNDSLQHVRVWGGEWETEARGRGKSSLQQAAVRTPAALISLVGIDATGVGRTLRPLPRPGAPVIGAPGPKLGDPRPVVTAEIAVTLLVGPAGGAAAAGAPNATRHAPDRRAAVLIGLVERALLVCVDHGLRDLAGEQITTPALRAQGLAGFVISGRRSLEILPAPDPAADAVEVSAVLERGLQRPALATGAVIDLEPVAAAPAVLVDAGELPVGVVTVRHVAGAPVTVAEAPATPDPAAVAASPGGLPFVGRLEAPGDSLTAPVGPARRALWVWTTAGGDATTARVAVLRGVL